VMGDTRKFFHDGNIAIFLITYVGLQYAYFILEGEVRSLLALTPTNPCIRQWGLLFYDRK